ncbi:MAG TPA: SRPBCC family protein [Polyangiaceae bacterium]|jgi:hypothetical protein|nr:SRPBCC family protein [Polyangiaceae bacterium]
MTLRRSAAALTLSFFLASCAPRPEPSFPASPPAANAAAKPVLPRAPAKELPAGPPPPASALAAEGFFLTTEEKGVRVYRREERSGVELAAEGDFKAPPAQVARALTDFESFQSWQKHLAENRILARGPNFLDVYQRLDLPFLGDRDFSLHVTWGNEGDVFWTRFVLVKDLGPAPKEGVVRALAHDGAWRFEPRDGGRATHAVYRLHVDLDAFVPSWMSKGKATSELLEVFEIVAQRLPIYQGRSLPRGDEREGS